MKPPTTAAALYEHVAWDSRAAADDGYGNTVGSFDEQFACRARFTWLRGGEGVIAGRIEGRQPIVVRVRASIASRQITTDWRMRDLRKGAWADSSETQWNGPVYAVRSVAETEDRRWIDVMVEGGVAA